MPRLIDADALMEKLCENLRDGEVLYRIPPSAIDNAPTIDPAPRWIPVTERLPEMKADVLMYFAPDKNMAAGFMCDVDEDKTMWCAYTDGGFYTDCDFEPTHWMPLPKLPEDGGAENA